MALLDFAGKTVVITGAATGMGAETTRLLIDAGAVVHALDVAPVQAEVETHHCDLGDRGSIDATIADLPDRIDVVMNCAGVPNGGRFTPLEVMAVNWLGLRHLTESLLPRVPTDGSIVHIASTAGRAWADHRAELTDLLAADTFEDGLAWCEANPGVFGDGYSFSKEAVQFYTIRRSVELLDRSVRMNSICPGITATQIIPDFRKGMGDDLIDTALSVAGRFAEPSEMAPAMLFLADHASSSYITGINLNLDHGTGAMRIAEG